MGSTSGNTDETPVHSVTISDFKMMKTEVTNGQFAKFLNYQGNSYYGKPCVNVESEDLRLTVSGGVWSVDAGYENHPVVEVTWLGALRFCEWSDGRLPSESEWEFAARNGAKENIYPWGDEVATCDYAVMDDDFHTDGCDKGKTWTVCSKTAGNTNLGLCDIAGNVWEWVNDRYHENYKGAPTDGSSWYQQASIIAVLRGGSFDSSNDYLRSSNRSYAPLTFSYPTLGFRCARRPF